MIQVNPIKYDFLNFAYSFLSNRHNKPTCNEIVFSYPWIVHTQRFRYQPIFPMVFCTK